MAKNKKAQILAAVMCAATVAGVSPAISSAAPIASIGANDTVTVNGTPYTGEQLNELFTYVGDIQNAGIVAGTMDEGTASTGAISMGENSKVHGTGSIAIGKNSNVSKFGSVALGIGANAKASGSVALGAYSIANEDNTVSIGRAGSERRIVNVADAINDHDAVNMKQMNEAFDVYENAGIVAGEVGQYAAGAMAIGENSQANGVYGVAIGNSSKANGTNSVAVGRNATVNEGINYGVALGAYSVATEEKTVSVGRADIQRRIVNVADGINDSDAATVGQLNAVKVNVDGIERVDANKDGVADTTIIEGQTTISDDGKFTTANNRFSVTQQGDIRTRNDANGDWTFEVDSATGDVTTQGNVKTAEGADLNAINDTLTGYKNAGLIAGTNNGEYNTVMGYDSWSNGDYNTVIGNQANIDGSFGVALGAHATVVGNNSVAIGYNSQALRDDVVSVGSFGQERQITNVAAGTENTDAVNYGQLKEVKTDLGGVSANVAGITRTGSDEEGYTTDIEGTIQVNNDGTFRAGNDKNYIGMSDAALNARFNGNGLSIGFDGTSVFGGKTRVDYNDNGATFYYGTSDEQLEYGTTNIKGGNITTNNIVVGQGADAVKIGNGDVELADGTKLSDIANKVDSIDTDISGIEDKVAGIERDEATGTTTIEDNTTISKDGITYKGENGLSTTIDGNGIAVGDKTFIKDGEISTDNINVGSINGKDVSDLASNADVAGLKDRVGTVETDVKGIKEDIGDVNAIDGDIKGDNIVSSINNEVNTRRSEISRIDNDIKHLDNRVGSLEDRMGDVEDRIDKVGAMSAAIANLRTMGYDPEAPTEIAVGVGQYKSETGLALGVFHYPNEDFMLSASISTSGDEVMGGIGATWKLGRKSTSERAVNKEKSRELKAEEKAAEMKQAAQKSKVDAQRERHAKMLAEREAANK